MSAFNWGFDLGSVRGGSADESWVKIFQSEESREQFIAGWTEGAKHVDAPLQEILPYDMSNEDAQTND